MKTPTERLKAGEKVSTEKRGGIKPDGTISSYRTLPIKEKREIVNPTPEGWVKVVALIDYTGMTDVIYAGDVFLLPERKFKSLAARSQVEEYFGDKQPMNKR